MVRTVDKTGERYGRLVVTARSDGVSRWVCQCDCGNVTIASGSNLNSGRTSSCGCLRKEKTAETGKKNTTHGLSNLPLFGIWDGMKSRCLDETDSSYHHYGGRGISVHPRWLDSLEAFQEDMGERPSLAHSIDRIEVDGHYEPGNCRWATAEEQANNKRTNVRFELNGENLTLIQVARKYGVGVDALVYRLNRGDSIQEAICDHKPHLAFTRNGVTKRLKDWVDELGLDYKVVYGRIFNCGWSFEEAVSGRRDCPVK